MEDGVLPLGGHLRGHQLVLRDFRHGSRAAVEQDHAQELDQSATQHLSHELTFIPRYVFRQFR